LILAGFYSFYHFFSGHDFFRPRALLHQLYTGSYYFRPNGFFSLPTTYAYSSAMFFSFSLAFWLREKPISILHDRITRFYLFISTTNIFLTFTRAAWIAFSTSVAVILSLLNKKLFLRMILVIFILLPLFYSSMPSFQKRIDSIFDLQYIGNHHRIYLWKANWNIFKENPWVGIGFNQNLKNIDFYLNAINRPEVMRSHPHSTYLNFLAGLGSFGFLFFMLFVILNLARHSRYTPVPPFIA
jgi:O-antigen ligase